LPFQIETFVSLAEQKGATGSGSQSESGKEKEREKPKEKSTKRVPEWKCYVKTSASNSLLLTILPASFEDVIFLHSPENELFGSTTVTESSEVDEAKSAKVDAHKPKNNVKPIPKTENPENENSQQEKTRTENHEDQADEATVKPTRKKLKLVIPEKQPEPKALCIPVYIYDCVSHNVLSKLIHPWDFQLPTDIYQDLTFDPMMEQSEPNIVLNSPRVLKRVSFSADSLKVVLLNS